MNTQENESKYTREDFARSSEEVPFYPFRPVSMAHIDMDEIELLQFEFMQQAGQPDNPTD